MTRENAELLAIAHSLKEQLKAKGRRGRHETARRATHLAAPRLLRNDVLPDLQLVHLRPDELRLPLRKTRKQNPAHLREIAGAISALGFCDPILIGKDNLVIDGGARLEAAKLHGFDRVPCIQISHLTENEQRVLRLVVNRLGEKGEWNLDELKFDSRN